MRTLARATREEQRHRILKARVAITMYDEYGKVPTEAEIERTYRLARVLYKAAHGTHYLIRQQQKHGQLVLF